jgi:cytochrome c6
MNKQQTIIASIIIVACGTATSFAASGEELFKQHCVACHKDGGNIINPKRTLNKKDMAQEGIKNAQGIVKFMRNPGPGMTKFDKSTLPDKDAKAIADYVIKTFK